MQNQQHNLTEIDTPSENVSHLTSGVLIAATLAPMLGFFTLMVSHHISRLSKSLDHMIHAYGHWIPGSTGTGPDGSIGSYTGKETLALAVWLVSWLIFHVFWRHKEMSIKAWIPCFLGGVFLITVCFFHPIIDPIVLFIAESMKLI